MRRVRRATRNGGTHEQVGAFRSALTAYATGQSSALGDGAGAIVATSDHGDVRVDVQVALPDALFAQTAVGMVPIAQRCRVAQEGVKHVSLRRLDVLVNGVSLLYRPENLEPELYLSSLRSAVDQVALYSSGQGGLAMCAAAASDSVSPAPVPSRRKLKMSHSIILYMNPPTKPGAYVYLFTFDGVRVYVGKGTGRRLLAHERAARQKGHKTRWQSALALALSKGVAIRVQVLAEGLSIAEANALEVCFIEKNGRRDLGTGTLYNRTAGGDGLTREEAIRIFKNPVTRRKLLRARDRNARDAVFRANLAMAQRRGWSDPATRARRVAINRATLSRPGVREKMVASCAITNQKPEVRALRSASAKALHKDPEYQLKLYSALRRAANRPERKAQVAEQMRERNKNPEFTARRIEGIKKYWARLRARSET